MIRLTEQPNDGCLDYGTLWLEKQLEGCQEEEGGSLSLSPPARESSTPQILEAAFKRMRKEGGLGFWTQLPIQVLSPALGLSESQLPHL